MRPLAFSVIDVVGAALWSVTIGLAGLAIVHGLELLVADLHQHEWLVATGLLAAVSLVLLVIHGLDCKTFVIVERLLGKVIRRKD